MKEKFSQIEKNIQDFFEKQTLRFLGLPDAENDLAQRLVSAMQAETRTDDDGRLVAPNNYTLSIAPKFAADLHANQELMDKLAAHLYRIGLDSGIHFDSQIAINIFPDENVAEGEYEIHAFSKKNVIGETQNADIDTEELGAQTIPPNAFLIIGGSQVYTLEKEVINIGRKLDNNLVIDDPRVSRKHCQLRAIKGRYMLFDLESSGGTYLNGERVTEGTLHPGDVISLAGVPMVYGEDAVKSLEETQDLGAIENTDADHQ
jgi:hypothetical protein